MFTVGDRVFNIHGDPGIIVNYNKDIDVYLVRYTDEYFNFAEEDDWFLDFHDYEYDFLKSGAMRKAVNV